VLGYTKRQKKTQWISQEVLNLSDRRKQLKAVKSLSEENKTQYNITREIKWKVKECKEKWLEEKCIEVERSAGRQNSQKLFRTVNEICGTFTPKLPTVNNNTGKTLDHKTQIKARWKQHFEGLNNEHNPVDKNIPNELPTANGHEKMDTILELQQR